MLRTLLASLLVLMTVVLSPSPAQAQEARTTVEEWQGLLERIESGDPQDGEAEFMGLMVQGMKDAMSKQPAAVQNKVKQGQPLSYDELNATYHEFQLGMGVEMAVEFAGEMGQDVDVEMIRAEMATQLDDLPPGGNEERSIRSLFLALAEEGGGAAVAPVAARPATPTTTAKPAAGVSDLAEVSTHWKDFIHYGRVARPELAAAHGKSLVELNAAPAVLLEAIESSRYAKDYTRDLARMQRMEGEIADVATMVTEAIDVAKLAVIRDPDRIRDEIQQLDDGLRARMNATRRLKEAGEYTAPHFLDVLLSDTDAQQALRPYVIEAMVEVGRPIVIPLCEAFDAVPAVQKQDVARVLGRIGYPASLPYLTRALENGSLDGPTQQVVAESVRQITASRAMGELSAAGDLFYALGEDYYAATESLILEPGAAFNLRWMVSPSGRLTYQRIPTAVYPDVMAMQCARRALQLEPSLADAFSLWLAANFRRENNLPADMTDPSYAESMRSPAYYAMMAGPDHVKPVLGRAIAAVDDEQALDAVRALRASAGTGSLLSNADSVLGAMNYPDPRVRFEATFMVVEAHPPAEFVGAGRVVPVLAEAVRKVGKPFAIVVADEQEQVNQLVGQVREIGNYDVVSGTSLEDVSSALDQLASVDLVVIQSDRGYINAFSVARENNYKLLAAPMIAVARPGELTMVTRQFVDDPTVIVTDSRGGVDALTASMSQAKELVSGRELDDDQRLAYTLEALGLMHELAVGQGEVFDVTLAMTALVDALGDSREPVVLAAAAVLAQIDPTTAQQALAEAALDADRGPEMQIKLLGHLAEHARLFGNKVTTRQGDLLLGLVDTSRGAMSEAAAEAYGALNMPTARGVDLITR